MANGGLDLTITEQFARSMSVADALGRHNLLCYEMNGEPLPPDHGFPVRLIAPGLVRSGQRQVADAHRGDRPSLRGSLHGARLRPAFARSSATARRVWTFATVSHARLKSAPAKVTKRGNRYTIVGVAWGAPIAAVQVRIDGGPWRTARLFGHPPRGKSSSGYAWRFWTFDWGTPAPGEHRITSRAFDIEGNVQPAPDNPFLASKRTYWESNGHITRRVSIT